MAKIQAKRLRDECASENAEIQQVRERIRMLKLGREAAEAAGLDAGKASVRDLIRLGEAVDALGDKS